MSRKFYIGCTHWGHENIIRLSNRPFETVQEMNSEMVRRWNSVVGERDTVYHLGDFAYKHQNTPHILQQLNGYLVRVRGNHDPGNWGSPYYKIDDDGRKVVLFHFPIEEWDGWYKGAFHIHAHTHKPELLSAERRFNVSAEAVDYTPLTLDQILERTKV